MCQHLRLKQLAPVKVGRFLNIALSIPTSVCYLSLVLDFSLIPYSRENITP